MIEVAKAEAEALKLVSDAIKEKTGDPVNYLIATKYLETLNLWMNDWCLNNPINEGIHWSCGQEVSIRLMHVMLTWIILDYPKTIPYNSQSRERFVYYHLKRIACTRYYARAQENNHWISESAALYIGGNWLVNAKSIFHTDAKKWAKIGKKDLETSVKSLIMNDGSFSQYSLTYHRLVLDTMNQVEIWRRKLALEKFSFEYEFKYKIAVSWHRFL